MSFMGWTGMMNWRATSARDATIFTRTSGSSEGLAKAQGLDKRSCPGGTPRVKDGRAEGSPACCIFGGAGPQTERGREELASLEPSMAT